MNSTIMLSPLPYRTFICSSGNEYVADQYGIIAGVQLGQDVTDLQNAGCKIISPTITDLLGYALALDFNKTTDQIIPVAQGVKYRPKRIVVTNTTLDGMSTAQGGIYTATGKGGSLIVAASQAYTGLTNASTALELTLNSPTLVLAAATPLYLSLTTAQGAAAKADVYVFGDTYPQ